MLLNTKQFSDVHFIKDAVRDLMELPLEKLTAYDIPKTGSRKSIEVLAEVINQAFGISVQDCLKMTFGEFVTITDALDQYSQRFSPDTDEEDKVRFHSAYIRKMLILNRQLPEIRIYNAINVKEYLELLNTLCLCSNTGRPARDKRLVVKIQVQLAKKLQQMPDMNLGQALDILDRKACAFWIPWCRLLDDYAEQIRDAYDMRWWLIGSASNIILSQPYKATDIIERYKGDLSFLYATFHEYRSIGSSQNIKKDQ